MWILLRLLRAFFANGNKIAKCFAGLIYIRAALS